MKTATANIACLVPVRNGAAELPDWLEAIGRVVVAVIALDDGSIDGTREILEAHPLVKVVLTNPPRTSHLGWDDSENRNRLLAAAAAVSPDWILFLDIDERLDTTDADALVAFVESEALAGCAYGFQWFRMRSENTYDRDYEWVYRLFRFTPGLAMPDRRFDFPPVPISIPQAAWVNTTVRIMHFGETTDDARDRRQAKYREADPSGTFADYYEQLGQSSAAPYPSWTPRQRGLPVLFLASATPTATHAAVATLDQFPLPPPRSGRAVVVALVDDPVGGGAWRDGLDPVADVVVALRDAAWRDLETEADWLLVLREGEAMDRDDAVALRSFIDEGAPSGFVYGFRRYLMLDPDHYAAVDPEIAWRLVPAHVGINGLDKWPTVRRLETSIRLRYDGLRPSGVPASFESDRHTWARRSPTLPVVYEPHNIVSRTLWEAAQLDLGGPVLTVVIVGREVSEHDVDATTASLQGVMDRYPFEIRVAASGAPAALNPTILQARGDVILFVDAGQELDPSSIAEIVEAHDRGFAVVTGAVTNANPTRSGWAPYFLDHSASLPGSASGEITCAPGSGSWSVEALRSIGGFASYGGSASQAIAAETLRRAGHRVWRGSHGAGSSFQSHGLRSLVVEHYRRGAATARVTSANLSQGSVVAAWRDARSRFTGIRTRALAADAEVATRFKGVAPQVVIGVSAHAVGFLAQTLRRRARRWT